MEAAKETSINSASMIEITMKQLIVLPPTIFHLLYPELTAKL